MRNILNLVAIAIVTFSSYAQWQWQNPIPQGNSLYDLSFINEQIGWATGENGAIIKTIDGGLNWSIQESGTTQKITSICFSDPLNGWALSYEFGSMGSEILQTADGGENWTIKQTINHKYNSIYSPDSEHVWLVGDEGKIYVTKNGGFTWYEQSSNTSLPLEILHFSDSLNGIAAGGLNNNGIAIIIITANGGESWTTSFESSSIGVFVSLEFIDQNNGFAAFNDGSWCESILYRTNDGGYNWSLQSYLGISIKDVFSTSLDSIWVIGTYDTGWGFLLPSILFSSDGGLNWSLNYVDANNAIQFINSDTGYIVHYGGRIIRSIDGGSSWSNFTSSNYSDLKSIYFIDSLNGFAVGKNYNVNSYPNFYKGGILKTDNGGLSWSPTYFEDYSYFNDVVFIDNNYGWIVGNYGAILSTTNAGEDWICSNLGGSEYRTVCFTDHNNGWIGGFNPNTYKGKILHTNDGGQNWINQFNKEETAINDVYFIDSLNGWAAGNNFQNITLEYGFILTTNDGGNNWNTVYEIDYTRIYCLSFINSMQGWAVGRYYDYPIVKSIILNTINGGIDWTEQFVSYEYNYLVSIFFTDELNGWVVGDNGNILYTTDSGFNWYEQNSGTNNWLITAYFSDQNNGWVVGDNGTILHTNNGGVVTEISRNKPINSKIKLFIYPNPISAITNIEIELLNTCLVQLSVYDLSGKICERIVSKKLTSGSHHYKWNVEGLPQGVYFCVLKTSEGILTKKIIKL